MKFIITIDTEGDNQWDHGRTLTVENIKYVPRFQTLCEKYGIKPTYLVTTEICRDSFAKEIFTEYSAGDRAEIGTHLHSWTTPPFLPVPGLTENDPNHAFASELPDDLLASKIRTITEEITESFGKHPTSFRSGRYGFNKRVAEVLVENGYLVDSSITPFVSWSGHPGLPGGEGGPDFIHSSP
ncbi:deacetylase, partial [bacterium]|nr:deacetylase [bacterium]